MSGAGMRMGSGTSMRPGTSMKKARAALEASRGRVLATVADAETILTQAAGSLEERTGAAEGQVDRRVFEATYVFLVHRP